MLRWSLNLFSIRGIQLAIHGSFFLLVAYVGWDGWSKAAMTGAVWNVATVVAFFTCVVLHELGHSFTAMRFGVGVRRILLMPIGGMAEFDSIPRQPSRELLITLAGPLVNFVIAAVLWTVVRTPLADVSPYSLPGLLQQLLWANVVMGCFNLLPAFPMDGGRILRAVLATRVPYLRATWWAATIGKLACIGGVVIALVAPLAGWTDEPLILPAILFAFIFFAGEMEYRATVRREQEDAYWRQTLAQLYAARRPVDDPPVLSP